ncbi:MAG: hypothetical protein H0V82_04100 [Candidatus Protochlamydia sp.]|nr:hypothetical protein [Candidatus Protochlamydia sp.]
MLNLHSQIEPQKNEGTIQAYNQVDLDQTASKTRVNIHQDETNTVAPNQIGKSKLYHLSKITFSSCPFSCTQLTHRSSL